MYGSGKAAIATLASALMVVSTLAVLTAAVGPAGGPALGVGPLALLTPERAGPAAPIQQVAVHPAGPSCTTTVTGENVGDDAIQTAINAASADSVICIASGLYPEQLTIDTPGLTLYGAGNGTNPSSSTIIEPSATGLTLNTYDFDASGGDHATPSAAIILVEGTSGTPKTGTSNVALENLRVDGTNGASAPVLAACNDGFDGIVFQNSSGSLSDVAVNGVELAPGLFGCQQGLGVYVYDGYFNFPYSTAPKVISIQNSTVTAYDKNGVTCNDPGVTCEVGNLTARGIGSTTLIAQNGIQLAFGAAGTVQNSNLSYDAYSPTQNVNYFSANEGNAPAGILVYDADSPVHLLYNHLWVDTQGVSLVATPTAVVDNNYAVHDAYGFTFDLNTSSSYLYGLPVFSTATPWVTTAYRDSALSANVGFLVYDDNVTLTEPSTFFTNVSVEEMLDAAGPTYTNTIDGGNFTSNVSGVLLGDISSFQTPGPGFYPKTSIGTYTVENTGVLNGTRGPGALPGVYGIAASGASVSLTGNAICGIPGFPPGEYVTNCGFTYGITVDPAVATIEDNSVVVSSTLGGPGLGIWAGNAVAADPDLDEPTGTVTISHNAVVGPGGGAYTSPEAGSAGIQAAAAELTISDNTISGFSDAAGNSPSETGYNWYQGTQSVAIMAACSPASAPGACSISGNDLSDNVIGIVNLLWNSAFSAAYQSGPISISDNQIDDSLGYGIFQEWTNDGLSSGPVSISDNTIDNSASGALGMLLGGGTFYVDSNVLIGTSATGTQGASEPDWVGGPLATVSVAVVTGDEATTHVTLDGNVYLDTTLYTTFLSYPGSTFSSGEPVTFVESGLAGGTSWAVTANGTAATSLGSYASAQGTIAFQFQNSSSPVAYSVPRAGGLTPSPSSGTVTVSGAPITVDVTFSLERYTVTFTETGMPARKLTTFGWSVILNGTVHHSSSTTITFSSVPNGTFPVIVLGPYGFQAHGAVGVVPVGEVVVRGATSVAVTFSHGRTYALIFDETGLRHTSWCVTVNGYEQCTTTASIRYVTLTPATYTYAIGSVAGHTATVKVGGVSKPVSGTLTIPPHIVRVHFAVSGGVPAVLGALAAHPPVGGTVSTSARVVPTNWAVPVVLVGAIAGLLGGALNWRRRMGAETPDES